MLSERQRQVLRIIVADYVASAQPVASKSIVARHGLPVSSATVRNDMMALEEEGYITRPHTSGGGVPSDQGYRYYVDSLLEETPLPAAQRQAIRRRFQSLGALGPEWEAWCQAAAAELAGVAHNAAVVTLPRATESHVRQVQLVALQETLALLVLVMQEAKLRQQLFTLPGGTTQDDLTRTGNRLTHYLAGRSRFEVSAVTVSWSELESSAVQTVMKLLQEEDLRSRRAAYVDGLRHILGQPEFASGARAREVVEAIEERDLVAGLLAELSEGRDLSVVIGGELPLDALRQCSVVVASYGRPSEVSGTLGVVGPTRMDYSRAIATARFLRDLLDELLASPYPGQSN